MIVEMGLEFNDEVQVAHRLSLMPGKCQNIHGHSMVVFLTLHTRTDIGSYNVADVGDFGAIKSVFRGFLKDNLDHKLLLNENDPLAQRLRNTEAPTHVQDWNGELPGLVKWQSGDPTTEAIAFAIANWAHTCFEVPVTVRIDETCSNAVCVSVS